MRAHVMMGVVLATVIAAGAPARASEPATPTHVAVFDSVAARVAEDLLPPGAIPPGRSLELVTPLAGDTLSLLEQRLLSHLKREGVSVRIAKPAPAPTIDPVTGQAIPPPPESRESASLRLEANVEAKGISYLRRVGKFPFGTKGFERLVTLQAQSRLLDAATGEVLWARTGSARVEDLVRARDVEAVAASGTGFFRPSIPPKRGLRFLEPVIVAGVVVGLVVLFYSNRT
jgi:hypothetical protein